MKYDNREMVDEAEVEKTITRFLQHKDSRFTVQWNDQAEDGGSIRGDINIKNKRQVLTISQFNRDDREDHKYKVEFIPKLDNIKFVYEGPLTGEHREMLDAVVRPGSRKFPTEYITFDVGAEEG